MVPLRVQFCYPRQNFGGVLDNATRGFADKYQEGQRVLLVGGLVTRWTFAFKLASLSTNFSDKCIQYVDLPCQISGTASNIETKT